MMSNKIIDFPYANIENEYNFKIGMIENPYIIN
jgi:hypothetical protein